MEVEGGGLFLLWLHARRSDCGSYSAINQTGGILVSLAEAGSRSHIWTTPFVLDKDNGRRPRPITSNSGR